VRPLKQSLEEFRRFSYNRYTGNNLLVKNAVTLFDIRIWDSKLYIGTGAVWYNNRGYGFKLKEG